MPIRHTTVATFADEPGAEINKAEWNADHTSPDIADVTGLTAALAAKQTTLVSGTNIKTLNGSTILGSGDLSISSTVLWGDITGNIIDQTDLKVQLDLVRGNVFYPEDYGTISYGFSSYTGVYNSGTNAFSDVNYTFTADDVGKPLLHDAFNVHTIGSVSAGVAYPSPAFTYGTTDILWQMGGDNKTAIRDAVTAAKPTKGTVLLQAGKFYSVTNTSGEYATTRAAIVLESDVTISTMGGRNEHASTIMAMPGFYGWIVANRTRGDTTSYSTLADVRLLGYSDFCTNMQGAYEMDVAYSGYLKVDPYNRVERVLASDTRGWGFRFKGRGELRIRDCETLYTEYGMNFDGQYDFSHIGGQIIGAQKTGILYQNGSNGLRTGVKVFYCGAYGAAVAYDCAGIVYDGSDYRHGFIKSSNTQVQETRGHSVIYNSNNIDEYNLQCQDPVRDTIASGTLPSNLSGIYFGANAHNIRIYAVVEPSVRIFDTPNWSADTDAVYIEGVDGSGNGVQKISGQIRTYQSIVSGGSAQAGINYSGTGVVKRGAGVTNGKNPDLYIDGIPCALTLGAAPASGDLIEIIDVSDTYSTPYGTKKLVAYSDFSGGGGGATSFTTVEKDLGSAPLNSGRFTITGLSGLTIGKPVIISQAVAPYTGKGTLADEAEMDGLIVKASVTAVDTITAYWNSATRVRGNFKFNYLIGA
jgi:hypothetical protein